MRPLNFVETKQISGGKLNPVHLAYIALGLTLPVLGLTLVASVIRWDQKRISEEKANIDKLTNEEAYELGRQHGISQTLTWS